MIYLSKNIMFLFFFKHFLFIYITLSQWTTGRREVVHLIKNSKLSITQSCTWLARIDMIRILWFRRPESLTLYLAIMVVPWWDLPYPRFIIFQFILTLTFQVFRIKKRLEHYR